LIKKYPKKLTHLTFGRSFNQSVDNLPESLIYIKFGYCFEQSISKLPLCVKYLKLYYNETTINNIPAHIETLNIEMSYNNYISNKDIEISNLPISLTKLIIRKEYIKYIKKLPLGVNIKTKKNPILQMLSIINFL
jgi:hypothetical protein